MPTVTISWNNPDDGYGNLLTDIDNIAVYRVADDVASFYPKSGSNNTPAQAKDFSERSDAEFLGDVGYSSTESSFAQEGVESGSYTSGVFSKNSSGLGPGDIASIVVP